VYKVIEIIGVSDKGFTEAAGNAVEVAAKTVNGIQWAGVEKFGIIVKDNKIVEYQARTKIKFKVR
jgi:flavin-binding protein dodecin